MSNGLGKANYETNADEYIASFSEKASKEKSNVEEKNENDIYIIDDENYK